MKGGGGEGKEGGEKWKGKEEVGEGKGEEGGGESIINLCGTYIAIYAPSFCELVDTSQGS